MSTKCGIIIDVTSLNKGKGFTHNKAIMPKREIGKVHLKFPLVTLGQDTNFIATTIHWNGYPEGVGAELQKTYNSFELAFNLSLGGALSTICGKCIEYYYRVNKRDTWDRVHPMQLTDLTHLERFDYLGLEYIYLFRNGKWYVCDLYHSTTNKKMKFKRLLNFE